MEGAEASRAGPGPVKFRHHHQGSLPTPPATPANSPARGDEAMLANLWRFQPPPATRPPEGTLPASFIAGSTSHRGPPLLAVPNTLPSLPRRSPLPQDLVSSGLAGLLTGLEGVEI